ncbi:SulP family inorganic anion transporter, partial [Streptomyces sp. NPDC051162]|uniref:SulP family inorganic anion transporter n=1 Tax=Streptomyces sp. NPDC051162 TaxID=3154747 RepID=UPI003441AA89
MPRAKLRSNHRSRTLLAGLRADVTASLVVFLIAVPLSVGIAVASGVPVELGLVTGVVGGLLTGLLPGSSLQVSGPAADLTVLVYEAVRGHRLGALGVLVLAAGVLQIAMGLLRLGRWFRAISVSVVQGMLAGIGLVLIAGPLYALADARPPAGGLEKLGGLPGPVRDVGRLWRDHRGEAVVLVRTECGAVGLRAQIKRSGNAEMPWQEPEFPPGHFIKICSAASYSPTR